jgi:hypothetical protein
MTLLLLCYSTAVTVALTWFMLTELWSRQRGSATDQASGEMEGDRVALARIGSQRTTKASPLPPIPTENTTTLGRPLRTGDLEATPLAISLAPVELERSIDPRNIRLEETDSLVLRVRFRNLSSEDSFAPLEAAFVRDQSSPLDRCVITAADGRSIGSYSLAADSEWRIHGQNFSVLAPGGSVETLLASEPGAADLVEGEMTWRVRLRIGVFRSDVIGVRFAKSDVGPQAREPDPSARPH